MKTDKTKKNDFFKKTFLAICLVVVKNINKKTITIFFIYLPQQFFSTHSVNIQVECGQK